MNIENYIPKGKENAIHMQELKKSIGFADAHIRTLIKKARLNGAMICGSSLYGYWKAENKAEFDAYNNHRELIAKAELHDINEVKKAVNNG